MVGEPSDDRSGLENGATNGVGECELRSAEIGIVHLKSRSSSDCSIAEDFGLKRVLDLSPIRLIAFISSGLSEQDVSLLLVGVSENSLGV